jgi:uncharacterized protein (DUF433 family)
MDSTLQRITVNPEVCHGKPTVRNLRYPVEMLLELLAAGMTREEILSDFPDLQDADISACLLYAAQLTQAKSIHKLVM